MTNDRKPVPDDSEGDAGQEWFTVQQAAEYLGVSQPTIFRWMKEGTLSFYKVGGATRFSAEGLDAVIEKTTGSKEAEQVAGRCAACRHSVLVEGNLQGAGNLYFRPDRAKFWVLSEGLVSTRAYVCPACGLVQLRADTERLRKLARDDLGDTPESDATAN
jgi:excisionase family DNA binding protein